MTIEGKTVHSVLMEHARKGEDDDLKILERLIGERNQLVMMSLFRENRFKEQAERLRGWIEQNDGMVRSNLQLRAVIQELKKEIRGLKRRGPKKKRR